MAIQFVQNRALTELTTSSCSASCAFWCCYIVSVYICWFTTSLSFCRWLVDCWTFICIISCWFSTRFRLSSFGSNCGALTIYFDIWTFLFLSFDVFFYFRIAYILTWFTINFLYFFFWVIWNNNINNNKRSDDSVSNNTCL